MPDFEIAVERTVVLIVEDEPLIRFATLDALEDVGHEALEAGNADEAMVIFRMRQDIDIVFTDVNMAGSMDGIQFANRVRAIRPGIGIIITSGLLRLDPMSLPANTVFLRKPYRHEELLESISLLTS